MKAMKIKGLKIAAVLAATTMLSAPVLAQEATTPAPATPDATAPVMPEATSPATPEAPVAPDTAAPATFVPPEGYAPKSDWNGVTAEQVKGTEIFGPDGASIGKVADVEVGADGAVGGAIADIGGFLGIGSHTVKIDTEQLELFANADGALIAQSTLDKDALKAMPEYTPPG